MQSKLRSKLLWCVVLTALALVWVGEKPSQGYNPPGGPNHRTADLNNPKTHGTIVLKAIDVLQGDGQTAIASFFRRYRQPLLDGVKQADHMNPNNPSNPDAAYWNPEVPGYGKVGEFGVNTMSHFYNPSTGKGLVLDLGSSKNKLVELMKAISWGDWELATLLGPHTAATDMADLFYAQAVDAMRRGDANEAMTQLGWALHYVGDCTVPQHATDQSGATPGSNHVEYENACDDFIGKANFPHATKGGIYNDNWRPGQFVEDAAKKSAPLLGLAKNPATFEQAARQAIPLAERLSAGLLARFYRRWANENFTVVLLTVTRVKDPTGDLDAGVGPAADFYTKVSVSGRNYPRTDAVHGGDDIYPQKKLPFFWVYPRWMNLPPLPQKMASGGEQSIPSEWRKGRVGEWENGGMGDAVSPTLPFSRSPTLLTSPFLFASRRLVVSKTKLEVQQFSKEFETWGSAKEINAPDPTANLTFRWTTEETGVKSARWEVTDAQKKVLASGLLTSVPGKGAARQFTIDFRKFIPNAPPKAGQVYSVRVIPLDAQNKARAASNAVAITYRPQSGTTTKFDIEDATHPRIGLVAYSLVNKTYANPIHAGVYPHAVLTLDVTNPGGAETDTVRLSVKDEERLFATSPLLALPRLKAGARQTVHVTMTPDLVTARTQMQAKHGNVVPSGGVRQFWHGQWASPSGRVTLIAHTSSTDQLKQNSERDQELTRQLTARFPYPVAVPLRLEIWDEDGGLAGDDDHCDINPVKGKRDLDFTYFLDGSLQGDVTAEVNQKETSAHSKGAGDDDIAEVWFKVEHFPRLPAHCVTTKPLTLRPDVFRRVQPRR